TLGPLPTARGRVTVVSAGTSDAPVAAEAALTARVYGAGVHVVTDVGVSGLHRVLAAREDLVASDCLVVVAGMEGALPSVVGGLVGVPLVAVPTSVGYGASFGWVDASSGASGDMLLGALVGAGVPVEVVGRAVLSVAAAAGAEPGDVSVTAGETTR